MPELFPLSSADLLQRVVSSHLDRLLLSLGSGLKSTCVYVHAGTV